MDTAGRFAGKTALVTGAGSGIGAATARRLAADGARVGLMSRTREELEEVEEQIRSAGGEAMTLVADITDSDALERGIEELADRYGGLELLVPNAGVNGTWAPLEELELDDFRKTVEINLIGTFATIRLAAPRLLERGGSVVVVASVNGTRMFSNSGATAYAATKAGETAMAKMLALELAPRGVRINVVCPGAIETQIDDNTQREHLERAQWPRDYPKGPVPLTGGGPGTSEQVADAIAFLLSDAASHITGSELWVDGAQSLLQG